MRPGLTGIAQIFAPRDVPRRHKFRYDLLYIRRQSFWLDLRLILLSFWITFRGAWERREEVLNVRVTGRAFDGELARRPWIRRALVLW